MTSVETALTSGVASRRSNDQRVIGKVFWRPVSRYVTANADAATLVDALPRVAELGWAHALADPAGATRAE